MKTKYERFVEELRQSVMKLLHLEEEQVWFVAAQDNPAGLGDCLFLECGKSQELKEICALHIEDLFQCYQKGVETDCLAEIAAEQIQCWKSEEHMEKILSIGAYEKIKEDLFVRLVNVKLHEEALKNVVYRVVGDIALVLYLRLRETGEGMASLKIQEEFFKKWDVAQDTVFEQAFFNTYFMNPPRIYHWRKLIYDKDYTGENFMDILGDFQIQKGPAGECLSTTRRTNGAVDIFLPGVAERLAQLMGNGFYMVFTSVHEVMIHNDTMVEPERLRQVLKETVEEATPQEDFLSYYIYHYEKETGEITYV